MNTSPENSNLSDQARRNLWMHFSRMGTYETHEVPVIVRGFAPLAVVIGSHLGRRRPRTAMRLFAHGSMTSSSCG